MLPKELLNYLRGETQRIDRRQKQEDRQAERHWKEQEKERQLDQQAEAIFPNLWNRLMLPSYLEAIRKRLGGDMLDSLDSRGYNEKDKPYIISLRNESRSRVEWPWFYLPTFPESVRVGIQVSRGISLIHLPLPAGVKDWEKLPHSLYHLRRAAEISVNLITGSHHPQREVTAEVEITGGCYIKRDSVRVFKDSPPAYRGSLSPFDSSFEKKMWQELQQALKHRTYSWIDYYDQGGGSKS